MDPYSLVKWLEQSVYGAATLRRRFEMFDSSATRPYTVSAMSCWKRAADLGYMTLDSNGKVCSTRLEAHSRAKVTICLVI